MSRHHAVRVVICEPPDNIVFIPMGTWANAIVDPDTCGCGMPGFKGVPARIEPSMGLADALDFISTSPHSTQTSTSPSVSTSSPPIATIPSAYPIDVIRLDPLNVGYATPSTSLTGR